MQILYFENENLKNEWNNYSKSLANIGNGITQEITNIIKHPSENKWVLDYDSICSENIMNGKLSEFQYYTNNFAMLDDSVSIINYEADFNDYCINNGYVSE